jgi:hypothetical protein
LDILVATWNIRYGWGNRPDKPRDFVDVLNSVRKLLGKATTAGDQTVQWVLGLQEVLIPHEGPNLVAQLADALGCDYRLMPLTDSYDPREMNENYHEGGWGLAILTNTPIKDGRASRLIVNPSQEGMPYLGQAPKDRIERYALNIPLELKNGEIYHFQVAHPTPHPWHARNQFKEFLCHASTQGRTISVADSNTFRFLGRVAALSNRLKIASAWGPTWPRSVFFKPDSAENNRKRAEKNGTKEGRLSVKMPLALFGVDNIVVPRGVKIQQRRKLRLGSDHDGLSALLTISQPRISANLKRTLRQM